MKRVFLVIIATVTTGCSILPYESDYSCRLEDNYGKCMSIREAYDGSNSNVDELNLTPGERVDMNRKRGDSKKSKGSGARPLSAEEMYVDDLYRELSLLIREPETPIIKAPKEMRTLILTYSGTTNKKMMYMPRYVYTIVEDAEFVVRQYFKTPERDAHMLEPRRSK